MAKPKSPLLSLGASGTVSDTLTYQKRFRGTIARKKPIPRDPYSLNQAYQRWDYRDYAHLWTLLSNSEKQVYRTKASRYHITGFSQWMRENLKTLPGLMGRWHLDERSGAIAYDSSKQGNNGTIIGASPSAGRIAGGYYFDGLNDYINCGHNPSLDLVSAFSIEAFIKPDALVASNRIAEKYYDNSYCFNIASSNRLEVVIGLTGGFVEVFSPVNALVVLKWQHVAATWDGLVARLYVDGIEVKSQNVVGVMTGNPAQDLIIGAYGPNPATENFPGSIDEVILCDYREDEPTIKRHSERRYPA